MKANKLAYLIPKLLNSVSKMLADLPRSEVLR